MSRANIPYKEWQFETFGMAHSLLWAWYYDERTHIFRQFRFRVSRINLNANYSEDGKWCLKSFYMQNWRPIFAPKITHSLSNDCQAIRQKVDILNRCPDFRWRLCVSAWKCLDSARFVFVHIIVKLIWIEPLWKRSLSLHFFSLVQSHNVRGNLDWQYRASNKNQS